MSRTENASRNIFWGFFNKVVSLGLPFATRTVMIYAIGMQYVGLGSLFSSILQVLSFAELGIGSALVFSMYKPMAEGDDDKVSALLNLYKKTYRIIGIVILAAGLLIMPFLDYLVAGDLPEGINLQVLFSIYLINNLVGYFLFAYKQSLFSASQRVDLISKIGMLLQLISSTAQIIILLTVRNYYAYVAIIPIITILNNITLGILADKQFPQYKCEGMISSDEKKEIEKKVGGMLFQKIGGIVLTSVDTIVISSFLGLRLLALYQNYYFIITALNGFLTVIMQSIIPSVGNSIASESVDKNYDSFKKFNFLYYWVVTLFSSCLLALYIPFVELWVGVENTLPNSLVYLFVVYFFIHKWLDATFVYLEAIGIWWENRMVPLLAALMNLTVNLLLVNVIGLYGILLSTIISILLVYTPGNINALFKYYFKMPLMPFIKKQIIYLLVSIILIVLNYYICIMISFENLFFTLLLRGIVSVIVTNTGLSLFYMKTAEFKYLCNLIREKVKT